MKIEKRTSKNTSQYSESYSLGWIEFNGKIEHLEDNMKRDYNQDIGYKPFLFYLIIGALAEELEVPKKRHKADELPEGLDIRSFTREA